MNLTWHIVRKDARRLAWPVAAWLAYSVVVAVSLHFIGWSPGKIELSAAAEWMGFWRSGLLTAGIVGSIAMVLMAGVLVLDDRVVGSTSFWLTRPISGGRLLRAKLLTAGLLFVVAPMIVMIPVGLAAGFDGGEVLRAAAATANGALFVLVALGLAALTADLGQHAFAVLVTVGMTTLTMTVLPSVGERGEAYGEAWETRVWLVQAIFAVAAGGALGWQYRTRRTARGWMIWVLALGGVAGVKIFWNWDLNWMARLSAPSAEEQRAVVVLRGAPGSVDEAVASSLRITVAGSANRAEFMAPVEGAGKVRWGGGTREVQFWNGETWARNAARRVAGAHGATDPMEWAMAFRARKNSANGVEAAMAEFTGRVRFARLRGRVLYELPWQGGASARSGGSSTRLVGRVAREPETMVAEERNTTRGGGWVQLTPLQVDVFVLLNRATGARRDVRAGGHQRAGAGGLVLDLVALTPELGPNTSGDGWTLVKVRFEPVGWFEREFSRVAIEREATEEKR